MPIETFVPPMRPSPGASRSPELSLRKTPFGDGYTQTSPAGLNHVRQIVSLAWDFLTLEDARAIEEFMVEHGGFRPFHYRLHGEETPRKWTCETWTITDNTPCKVQIELKESFTAGT